MTELVTDGLTAWARHAPDHPAIVFDGHDTVTYAELDRWTDASARHHAAAGLAPGDRVGIIGANSLEWVVAAIGALKLGGVVVPLNNRFTPDELRYLLTDAEPRIACTDAEHRARLEAAARGTPVAVADLAEFTALRAQDGDPVGRPDAGPDDVAQIVYTSGTSSRPKA